MQRLDELRRYIDKDALGLEVAPYFNPIAPKSQGYNVIILDVFDTAQLQINARADRFIDDARIDAIEVVDIVADASSGLAVAIEERDLAGKFSYIVSSHNFEHLPDPIRFLQGCAVGLKPGGTLTMALPDGRACFDHFRMLTRLSDWLAAYHRGFKQPSPEIHFDGFANRSMYYNNGEESGSCGLHSVSPKHFRPEQNLKAAYAAYVSDLAAPGAYRDAHCSVMFGASLEFMLRDLIYLGLIDLEIVSITPTRGHEFFVHLRKPLREAKPETDARPVVDAQADAAFYARRAELMHEINAQLGDAGFKPRHAEPEELTETQRRLRKIFGIGLVEQLRIWNHRRLNRRSNRRQPKA